MGRREQNAQHNEQQRIRALHALQILETPIEQRFEHITELLCTIFGVPVSALSFVDRHRQWFKSIQGLRVEQTMRSIAFCHRTVSTDRTTIVPDARLDPRFADNELVTGAPGVVFYAGVPVHAQDGSPVASLCLIDFEARTLDERQMLVLEQMAMLVESMLHTPRASVVEDSVLQHLGESWRTTMIDPLTRVWNAEGILTLIEESVPLAKRDGRRIGIAMMQLTGLDWYRAAHGNPAGDELLTRFARDVLRVLKPHDSIGRLRDGEFGIVLDKVESREELQDRAAILQMIADGLNSSMQLPDPRFAARVACALIHPEHQTTASQAMDLVEGTLTLASSDAADMPVVHESADTPAGFASQSSAA